MSNLISIYNRKREAMKESYENNFERKQEGKRYSRSVISIIREYCFKEWKSGKTQKEIAADLGFQNISTVAYHIKRYTT